MSEFKTKFSDGTGNVTIQYEGAKGAFDVPVIADCNCGADREVTINATPQDGEPVAINIKQEGLREEFIPSDQSTGMTGSDSDLFLGIKNKYAESIPGPCAQ